MQVVFKTDQQFIKKPDQNKQTKIKKNTKQTTHKGQTLGTATQILFFSCLQPPEVVSNTGNAGRVFNRFLPH